ncbi:MAG: hypothetical protein IKK11_03065, partial [Oscillospiraceae bacterium]|nr:hypothetical protein [Oscillospiraceae bacterium]
YDLRDYFRGLPDSITGIDGLTTDENGRIWMLANGILFSFTFDPVKKTIDIRKELDFSPFTRSDWFHSAMLQIDGYLYCNFGDKGGIRKVNMSDPSDNERLRVPATDYFAIGNDGNIYYTTGAASLWMYPLVVTDADWAAAEKMDEQFTQLKDITLESETAIKEARAAYEALSWSQKALIYNLDMLIAAEIDLLECKIDSLGEITLEDKALILEIKDTYAQLTPKNKNYVKNYKRVFIPALQALQAIEDQMAADAVQARIDTIPGMGEITLEKEADIRAIETAYNNLTKSQKALVNTKYLDDALAKIYVLRQERIAYLNELIAGFGEITLEDEPTVNEAREIFDWLTIVEREQVDFIALNDAETALKKLQKAAAAEVDALVESLGGSVSLGSGKTIKAARAAYEALTPGSKQYVKMLSILEEAETIYARLRTTTTIICIVVAVVVVAGGAAAYVIIRKKKAAAKADA